MAEDKLTHKQEEFARYVAEGNTYADSYRKVYAVKKMSANAIRVESSKLMENPNISLMVNELKKAAIKRNQVTLDQVLEQLKNWLLFDPLELIDEETECTKRLKDMPKEVRMSIAEITISEIWGSVDGVDGKKHKEQVGEIKKIKFVDKRATADMFMKKFGAYLDDKDNSVSDNLEKIKEIVESIKKL